MAELQHGHLGGEYPVLQSYGKLSARARPLIKSGLEPWPSWSAEYSRCPRRRHFSAPAPRRPGALGSPRFLDHEHDIRLHLCIFRLRAHEVPRPDPRHKTLCQLLVSNGAAAEADAEFGLAARPGSR